MKVGIVGRGRLGSALGTAADAAGHSIVFLRRPDATEQHHEVGEEQELDSSTPWPSFGLVLLAFEKHAESAIELVNDPALAQLQNIPNAIPIASVVATPSPAVIDAFLPSHAITHFLTTPAVAQPGAIALIRPSGGDPGPIQQVLPALHWVSPSNDEEHGRLALLMLAGAMACAAVGHLQRLLPEPLGDGEQEYLLTALDDAKRMLEMNGGDGFAAFASVATPGGITEKIHNTLFKRSWLT